MRAPVHYMKCFHVTELLCLQHKSRSWIIILNNVLFIDRQRWQNAVPSDEEWGYGNCLYTLMSGTVVTSDWGSGRTAVLWAVAQCSLVETDHDHRGAFFSSSSALMKAEGFSETLVLFYQTTWHNKPEDSNLQNIRSHKMLKFPPWQLSSTEKS
jgi:hypothetical protein